MQLTVNHNQNLFDVSIQENGNVMTVFELALLNGFSITDNIVPSQNIDVVKSELVAQELVDYFKNKNHVVATGGVNDLVIERKGIGKMIVGKDFIVG
nr:hypothetical protein [uncultured Flavobacterium sp.]